MENVNLVMPDEQDDFYEHHRIQVDRGQSLIRIDKFLFGKLGNVSRNKIQMAAKSGNILVNNKQEKSNYKVKPGDVISVLLPGPVKEFEIIAENIPINIVYEDDDIIAVSYTHFRAHETVLDIVCRLMPEKKKQTIIICTVHIM